MRLLQNTKARPVGGVSFGRGGQILVAGGSGGYDVWELATSSHTFIPSHNVQYIFGCVGDPLGRWVYVSDHLGGFRLLPLGGREEPAVLGDPYERHVLSFDLTSDGGRIALSRGGAGHSRVECWAVRRSGSFDPVWSILDGKPVSPDEPYLLNQGSWFTYAVALSPEGRTVATTEQRSERGPAAARRLLVIRDGATGKASAELGTSAANDGSRLTFAPDGEALFAWDERMIERWDVSTGRQTGQRTAPGRAYFRGLAVHPSGRALLTVSGDGQARYWDPVTLSPLQAMKWPAGKLHSLAISPDGTLAAAGGDKGQIVVWDVDV